MLLLLLLLLYLLELRSVLHHKHFLLACLLGCWPRQTWVIADPTEVIARVTV